MISHCYLPIRCVINPHILIIIQRKKIIFFSIFVIFLGHPHYYSKSFFFFYNYDFSRPKYFQILDLTFETHLGDIWFDKIVIGVQVFVLMQFDPGLEYQPNRGDHGREGNS